MDETQATFSSLFDDSFLTNAHSQFRFQIFRNDSNGVKYVSLLRFWKPSEFGEFVPTRRRITLPLYAWNRFVERFPQFTKAVQSLTEGEGHPQPTSKLAQYTFKPETFSTSSITTYPNSSVGTQPTSNLISSPSSSTAPRQAILIEPPISTNNVRPLTSCHRGGSSFKFTTRCRGRPPYQRQFGVDESNPEKETGSEDISCTEESNEGGAHGHSSTSCSSLQRACKSNRRNKKCEPNWDCEAEQQQANSYFDHDDDNVANCDSDDDDEDNDELYMCAKSKRRNNNNSAAEEQQSVRRNTRSSGPAGAFADPQSES